MKLAEALRLRSDFKKQVEELQARICADSTSVEGESPLDSVDTLLIDLKGVLVNLESLIEQINRTNASSELHVGMTMTAALAHRDRLMLETKCLGVILDSVRREDYYGMGRSRATELKTIVNLPVIKLREDKDDCASELRKLDMEIQAMNWQIDLAK